MASFIITLDVIVYAALLAEELDNGSTEKLIVWTAMVASLIAPL